MSQSTPAGITDPRVVEILSEIDGGRVLDLGCVQHDADNAESPNWLHQHLYDQAESVLGVDIEADEVAALQDEGYNVTVGDAERLDLDRTFDTIVAGELIEHLSNQGAFLEAAKDGLAEGGQLILTTPNPWCFARMKRLISSQGVPVNPQHTLYHDETTLRQFLSRHGFDSEVRFVGPMSEGISRRLYRLPSERLTRLGAPQLLAVAELVEQ